MALAKDADQADAALRAAGFDPAAPSEQALETLRALRGKPGADDGAIARALGNLKIAGAADLLAEMEHSASGAARREIRRALFRLRQRGIEPTRVPAAEPARPAAAPEPELTALLSPIDAEGGRAVWIMKPRLQGGLFRLTGITIEGQGLVQAVLDSVTRRELRAERASLEQRAQVKLVEADWRLADFILCEAWRHTPESRRREIGDFLGTRADLIPTPPPADFIHPVYAELLTEPIEPSTELLKEEEILTWRFRAEELKPYVDEINEIRQSPIVLNPIQQKERAEAVVERAATGLFGGERAERTRRRLEDTAYYMARTGREKQARWAAAAAAAIRDGADLKRIAFFVNFARVVLETVLSAEQERARQEPHLIVTPAEAMREREARERRR
jgi:hypothetical protein